MIIPKIRRNTEFNVTADEEVLLTMEFNIDSKILGKWK